MLLAISLLPVSSFATASPYSLSTPYIGALAGLGSAYYAPYRAQFSNWPTTLTNTGYATAFQVGYQGNALAGFELGAVFFPRIHFQNSISKGRFRNNLLYLVGKISYPWALPVKIFMKMGFGYIARNLVQDTGFAIQGGEFIRPVYGVGVNWRVAAHWDLELSWLAAAHLVAKQLPYSNYVGLGAHYLFC